MKILALTAALMLSGTAFAQATPPADPTTPAMPAPGTSPAGEMPASAPISAPEAMPSAQPAQAMAPMVVAPPPTAQAEYPRCSRTVVDQCIQGSARERNTKRARRR